ncbi:MAG: hypothetical protein GY842_14150, partial [bacterium]|nr:hypothetical protein [bacterium]
MTDVARSAEFDGYAAHYEACCARGLALSGESQDFFARGRVAWVQRWLAEHDNPAPGVVIDFGCGPGSTT